MKLRTRDIVLIGILSAILLIGKVAFDYIPNVEVVSMLLILFAITYGLKSIYISTIFCLCNGLMYGFGSWLLVYFIVYNGLVLVAYALRKPLRKSIFARVLFTSLFGLTFGVWFALEWGLMYGLGAGIAYYLNGVTFDLLHMAGNLIVMLLVSEPIFVVLDGRV
jgi:energy-coupling factor transport system substrate-specific component